MRFLLAVILKVPDMNHSLGTTNLVAVPILFDEPLLFGNFSLPPSGRTWPAL